MLFYLDQHGCAKNQVDGELLIGILLNLGWQKTHEIEAADLIIINSCGFIEPAKKESLSAVMTARKAYPKAKIVLAGCLAERYADQLSQDLPEADAFFGNGDLSRFPELLDSLFLGKNLTSKQKSEPKNLSDKTHGASKAPFKGLAPQLIPEQQGVCAGYRPELLSFPRSAYVKITEGCNNHCSFCAIPLIRGELRSRSIAEILAECKELIARGVFELNLIGQDLAAYGCGRLDSHDNSSDSSPLSNLLRSISELSGNFRVRLLYIHPDHFPLDILPVMTSDSRFYPYFDMPFQSGDSTILKAMNRKGSAQSYLALVAKIRSAFTESSNPYGTIALRTTFLAGFPGETEESFKQSYDFLKELDSLWSGGFVWSREEDTPAYTMKNRVSKKIAQARVDALKALQTDISIQKLNFFVGKTYEVLIEELIPEEDQESETFLALGRSWFQAPEVDGAIVLSYTKASVDLDARPIAPGSVVNARIIRVNGLDLEAVALSS